MIQLLAASQGVEKLANLYGNRPIDENIRELVQIDMAKHYPNISYITRAVPAFKVVPR